MSDFVFFSNVNKNGIEISIRINDDNGLVYLELRDKGMTIKRFELNAKYIMFADFYQERLKEIGLL